jgi:hypothetical protein
MFQTCRQYRRARDLQQPLVHKLPYGIPVFALAFITGHAESSAGFIRLQCRRFGCRAHLFMRVVAGSNGRRLRLLNVFTVARGSLGVERALRIYKTLLEPELAGKPRLLHDRTQAMVSCVAELFTLTRKFPAA